MDSAVQWLARYTVRASVVRERWHRILKDRLQIRLTLRLFGSANSWYTVRIVHRQENKKDKKGYRYTWSVCACKICGYVRLLYKYDYGLIASDGLETCL